MTTPAGAAPSEALPFLAGNSDMARRIRERDWSDHPFGPPSEWPQSLRSALSICLHSAFPTAIYWGPELRLLYNDAWAPIPGPRHPGALGAPAAEVWSDIWHVIGPEFDRLLATGEGYSVRDQMLPMRRFGVEEETYWNYAFTPIRDESGAIGGIFNSGNETTEVVLWQRKAAFLLELGETLRETPEPDRALALAAEMLGRHLGADRVGFVEVDPDGASMPVPQAWAGDGTAPLEPGVSPADLGPEWRERLAAGGQVRISDAGQMPELDRQTRAGLDRAGARALLALPWLHDGRLGAALFVHAARPRVWSEHAAAAARQTLEWVWVAVERARARERERLMAREIDHRAKNALAVVQAVARLTRAETIDDFRGRLEARIGALARSHNLLAAGGWSAVDLRALVEDELGPFLGGEAPTVTLDGAALDLEPEAAQTVALVLHELTTNAVKYGALSMPKGALAVGWRLGPDGALEFEWRETGPAPAMSARDEQQRGFGSELLSRAIGQQLGGTIEGRWEGGLPRYRIVLPLQRSDREAAGRTAGGAAPPEPRAGDGAPSILIAEDEPLVALELEDRLESFGYSVFASLGTLSDGLAAIEEGLPDGAVLDANLAGESSVALAERLHGHGVPVIFTTGYAVIEDLPEALAGSPLLTKPVADATLREALERTVGEPAGTAGPGR